MNFKDAFGTLIESLQDIPENSYVICLGGGNYQDVLQLAPLIVEKKLRLMVFEKDPGSAFLGEKCSPREYRIRVETALQEVGITQFDLFTIDAHNWETKVLVDILQRQESSWQQTIFLCLDTCNLSSIQYLRKKGVTCKWRDVILLTNVEPGRGRKAKDKLIPAQRTANDLTACAKRICPTINYIARGKRTVIRQLDLWR